MRKLTPKTYNLIALVGPTASGKSELAVQLAKRFNGEIISADSRQKYKGMDLGTGKVTGKWKKSKFNIPNSIFVYKGIPHHLIDFLSPKASYSVAKFQKQAQKIIKDITERGKLPIICGGTGFWVDAAINNQPLPDIKPNIKLRASLEKKSAEELFSKLQKLDIVRASTIDKFNKRRLIRALEIVITTGKPVPVIPASEPASSLITSNSSLVTNKVLWLGIKTNQESLYKKIDKRLTQRLKQGMVKEVLRLHSPPGRGGVRGGYGLAWKKLESFGLEYKYIALFLQNKITKEEMQTQLSFAIKHYSKRQLTWWKRNKNINWIQPKISVANKLITNFLKNV